MEEVDKINTTIDEFTHAIKVRMMEKYRCGYRGWDGEYSAKRLALELNKDSCELIKENDPVKATVDIGARAMMLWFRHNKPVEPTASVPPVCKACGVEHDGIRCPKIWG